jgi:hypothetical protein
MIGDPEQEHSCQRHGENINALSLFVIARNRSFAHCCAVLSGCLGNVLLRDGVNCQLRDSYDLEVGSAEGHA